MKKEEITEFTKNLNPTDHIIFFYDNVKDKQETLFTYLRAGLDKNEAAVYVVSEESPEEIKKAMSTFGINVKEKEHNNALKVVSYSDWYIIDGKFDISRTMQLWKKFLEESVEKGFKGLRVTGEMSCFFDHNLVSQLIEYENALHRKLEFPMIAICAYDLNTLTSKKEWFNFLINLMKKHQTTLMIAGDKGTIESNQILVEIQL